MADDQQNPFTMAGMMQMMQPNKYIDPRFKDKPLPLPEFRGPATDAMGNLIPSFTHAQAAHDAWQPPGAAAAPPPGQRRSMRRRILGQAACKTQPGRRAAILGLPPITAKGPATALAVINTTAQGFP